MTTLCRTDSPAYHVPQDSPQWRINAAYKRLEERARTEMDAAAPRFADWCADYLQASEIAGLIAAIRSANFIGTTEDAAESRAVVWYKMDTIAMAYLQFRTSDSVELGEIEAQIAEE